MKVFLVIAILLISVSVYADVSNEPCALALSWWLEKQGKLEGAEVGTRSIGKSYKITSWEVQGVPKPTKQELKQIIKDYKKDFIKPKTIEERLTELEQRVSALEP